MRRHFLGFADLVHRLTWMICVAAALVLTVAVLVIVVLRYGFGVGYIALQDLAGYAFAVLLVLSIPVCLVQGGHVRVEVFSEMMGERYQRRADVVSVFLLLIPVFGLAIWAHLPELRYSWAIAERSVETGGLPGLFIVKSALPLSAALMILQGIAGLLRPPPHGRAEL